MTGRPKPAVLFAATISFLACSCAATLPSNNETPKSFRRCFSDAKFVEQKVKAALEEAAPGEEVQIIKAEFCEESNVPVEASIIPLAGALVYLSAEKYTSLLITARVGKRIVGAELGTKEPTPFKSDSPFLRQIATTALSQ